MIGKQGFILCFLLIYFNTKYYNKQGNCKHFTERDFMKKIEKLDSVKCFANYKSSILGMEREPISCKVSFNNNQPVL